MMIHLFSGGKNHGDTEGTEKSGRAEKQQTVYDLPLFGAAVCRFLVFFVYSVPLW
jgi:hypothetical protein